MARAVDLRGFYRLDVCLKDTEHAWKITNKDELPVDHLVSYPTPLIIMSYNSTK